MKAVPVPALEELLNRWARARVKCERVEEAFRENGEDAPYTVGNGDGITSCATELEQVVAENAKEVEGAHE